MAYQVLALKYRPQRFEEMVGQSAIATTLANAIRTGRVAQAYVFAGPRGTGKTSMARIFAKALNCERGPTPEPCNQCDICRSIERGDDVDVREIDAASNRRIDDVREIRDRIRYHPARARIKIYYLDEAHMFTREAWNALLKTLEEPPEHVKFIFSTTEPEKMPETILSRCQRFDFRNLSATDIVRRLEHICEAEAIEVAVGVRELIARRARGGMRDAISLLDQLHAAVEGTITQEAAVDVLGLVSREVTADLFQAFLDHDDGAILRLVGQAVREGKDLGELLLQAVEHARVLLHLAVLGEEPALEGLEAGEVERLRSQAQAFQTDHLLHAVEVLAQARFQLRNVIDAQVLVEAALLELARLDELRSLGELATMVEDLGRRGRSVQSQPAASPGEGAGQARGGSRAVGRQPGAGARPSLSDSHLRMARGLWPELVGEVDGPAGQLLTHLAPVAVSGGEMLAAWNPGEEPEDTAALPGALEAAAVFLSTRLGQPVTVRVQPNAAAPDSEEGAAPTESAGAERRGRGRRSKANERLLRRAVELFEGTIEQGDG